MDMQTFGRDLVEVLAHRSLELIRNTKMSDVRDVMSGRFMRPETGVSKTGMTIGALLFGAAIGAGVTALLTPTSGPELRKRVGKSTRAARKQAMELGQSMASEVEHAGHALVENATTAIGLTSPAKRKTMNGHAHANGQARKTTRHAHA